MQKKEIISSLKDLGIQPGDIVLLHSSLASIGHVEGGADVVIDSFLDVLGSEGTLAVPIFGALGILTNTLKGRSGAVVSDSLKGQIAAIGKDAEYLCSDHWKNATAHGAGTPYLKLAEKDGKICLLGVDQDRNTTLHSAEALLELPYLEDVVGTVVNPDGKEIEKTWKYYPGPHRDFIQLDHILRESEKMKTGKVGNSVVRLIKSADLIDIACGLGRENPAFCLCDNSNCADCTTQKAAIFAFEMKKESFTLGTSAILAGRYVPEIIENMKNAGIPNIELDYLEGKPVQSLSREKLSKAIREFRENDIEVISLRASVADADISGLLEKAAENKIPSIIIPVSSEMEKLIKEADKKKIKISFYNTSQSSDLVTYQLLTIAENGLNPAFVFNSANFANMGELPFLGSFKKKLKRYIVQLDIEDMTFDGIPIELAKGNAEIKELISILRCASFSGKFILGAKNRFSVSLKEIVEKFQSLIYNM